MFGWAKNAVGLTDKHHGAKAIHSVKEQTTEVPFTELKKEDMRWEIIDNTNVETKIFYFTTDSGKLGLVQVIYSNVLNVKTTAQFAVKIFSEDPSKPHLWCSDNLSKFDFSNNKYDFIGDGGKCTMKIDEKGDKYTVKSTLNPDCAVDMTFTNRAPGFMVGRNGTSTFGVDPQKPHGKMKHIFWPRVQVEGTVTTKEGEQNMKGMAMHVAAVQGIKPHFAAARWNFAHFQSPTYSALSMEFTTPPSYDNTRVSVGGVAVDGKILFANANSNAVHTSSKKDAETDLPEPTEVTYSWAGKTTDGKDVTADIKGSVGTRIDRIDIMAELPKFLKGIVAGAIGARPFIYQFGPRTEISVTENGETKTEKGRLFSEATFIS